MNSNQREVSLRERRDQFVENPEENWGGFKLRLMLQCIYILAFLCLLRSDEVLKIKYEHIKIIDKVKGQIALNLEFRKTHQNGGTISSSNYSFFIFFGINVRLEIKPFHLYFNRTEPHLDPVAALLNWLGVSKITSGYIFHRVLVDDQIDMRATQPIVSSNFVLYAFEIRILTRHLRTLRALSSFSNGFDTIF